MYKTPQSQFQADFAAVRAALREAKEHGEKQLSEPDAKSLLKLVGIACPRGGVATIASEAAALCAHLAAPFAFKIASPDLLHKSAIGGVELNVAAGQQSGAYERLLERVRAAGASIRVQGVLIEEMQAGGVEMVTAVTRHAHLGWIVMLGYGGIWVEALRDVTFRLLPVDREDVLDMLGELKGTKLLAGVRGRPALDRDSLIDTVLRLGELALACDEDLLEIELNPLMVLPQGVSAADAVMRLRQND